MSNTAQQEQPNTVNRNLLKSLKTMLDAYWGEGDGMKPPKFILEAQAAVAEAEGT